MQIKLDQQLTNKYRKIFRNRYQDPKTSLMCWGFDCGDGWYTIIDSLCANIQHHIDWHRKARARELRFNRALKKALEGGNMTELLRFHSFDPNAINEYAIKEANKSVALGRYRELTPLIPQVVAIQVKEKFGGLRFYYSGGDAHIDGMVVMAESWSYNACETCGSPARPRGGAWIRTLCKEHRNET